MAPRLLDRQTSLLRYLTSGDAIFGVRDGAALDDSLRGIDRGLLEIEARFSHEKRMDKIVGVFPKTFELLGAGRETLVREFVDACPPVDIGRLENARQFCEFLCSRIEWEPPMPYYLRDVARCELALARARVVGEDRSSRAGEGTDGGRPGRIRRSPAVGLLRCAHDIRPIFEGTSLAADLAEHETRLAVVPRSRANQPEIFELPPVVFDLLSALDDWTDRSAFDTSQETVELVADLAEAGLVEIHR